MWRSNRWTFCSAAPNRSPEYPTCGPGYCKSGACVLSPRPLEETMTDYVAGRHFLQTPGPTNLPDRVLRAMDNNAINHRGPEFGRLGLSVIGKLRQIFATDGVVGIFPASG